MSGNGRRRLARGLFALGVAALAPASPAQDAAAPECFDAIVVARVTRQVPTEYPDCGADCIVMTWPWFVDIDVEEVRHGRVRPGPLRMLSLLHMRYVQDRALRMVLRRNAAGGWNQLRIDEHGLKRCAPGTPSARPYIRPGPGQTLDSLFRDSVANADRH